MPLIKQTLNKHSSTESTLNKHSSTESTLNKQDIKSELNELEQKIEKTKNIKNVKKTEIITKKSKKKLIECEETITGIEDNLQQIENNTDNNMNGVIDGDTNFMEQIKRINELKEIIESTLEIIGIEESIKLYSEMSILISSCKTYLETNKLKIQYV